MEDRPVSGRWATLPDSDVPTVSYCSRVIGEPVTLALYADAYSQGGGLAIGLVDATPGSEELGEQWGMLTVNLPDMPEASRWCSQEGHVVLDMANNSPELVAALVGCGLVELSGKVAHPYYQEYPLATVPAEAMRAMRGLDETVKEVLATRGPAVEGARGITRDMVRTGIEQGVIRFISNPDARFPWRTVCAIGDGWFYFVDTDGIGPEDYVRANASNPDMMVEDVWEALSGRVLEQDPEGYARFADVLSAPHRGGRSSLTPPPSGPDEVFCEVRWTRDDVLDAINRASGASLVRGGERAAKVEALIDSVIGALGNQLRDRSIELGWDVIDVLMPEEAVEQARGLRDAARHEAGGPPARLGSDGPRKGPAARSR